MTTIRDVAELAGVSIATISRVLNNKGKVSEETADRVRAIVKELDYVYVKQPLKPRRTEVKPQGLFAIILPTLSNPYFSELLDIVEQEVQYLGRSLLVYNSRGEMQRELSLLNICKQQKIDGLFIVPSSSKPEHIALLNQQPFPVVSLTQLHPELTSIAVDHAEGGAQVAEHLTSMGHTQIGYLGPADEAEQKFTGFRNKLSDLGIPLPAERIIDTPDVSAPELSARFSAYLDQHAVLPFSAIFVFNDVSAQLVIEVLQSRGYRVPEDVLVVGFDNTLIAQVMNISSVAQPIKEIGRLGFQEMMRLIEHHELENDTHHLILSPRLVLRNSSVKLIKRVL
nr:LacI family DNA-binding transcriptional regulator [uncultured Tolumonas sp.]